MATIDDPGADQAKRAGRARLADVLGPGLITGASDDDPSGIATYAQAGAAFGFALSWTLLFTYPLMCAIQMISAEIGRVTGKGIAANMRRLYPPFVLYALVGLLVLANVINIGADLGAMGAALRLMLPGPQIPYVAGFAALIVVLEVFMQYSSYASVLRWLTLSLFAYVATVFVVGVPWGTVLLHLVVPHIEWTGTYFTVVVAVFGTTISPYLFFWQASEEVEDVNEDPAAEPIIETPADRPRELKRIRLDTMVGMAASNLVALFIVLTTAVTLHAHGVTNVETSSDAAKALKPIAGEFAFAVFALGIVGTGLLAVPVLAGSAAYALARDARLAFRTRREARPRPGLLRGDHGRGLRRRGAQFLAARSDQGPDLQRGRQWRRRGSDHGHDHAHGLAAEDHGRVRPPPMAQGAGLDRDRCHGRRGRRHVRDLERLIRAALVPGQNRRDRPQGEESVSAKAGGIAYAGPPGDFAPRSNRRSRRIATSKNSTTSAIAATGAASARKVMTTAPPSSAVEMTKFPRPPVRIVEWARRIPVKPCVNPATPPPAMMAAVHFTIGGASTMTAADTIVPATKAAGVASASSRLSTTGM